MKGHRSPDEILYSILENCKISRGITLISQKTGLHYYSARRHVAESEGKGLLKRIVVGSGWTQTIDYKTTELGLKVCAELEQKLGSQKPSQ